MLRLVLLGMRRLLLSKREHVAHLVDALVDKVRTAEQQHDVANGETVGEEPEVNREQRCNHMYEIAREAEEDAAGKHRAGKAELAADMLLLLRQAIRGDRDEHDVVHTEHDLQKNERHEANPCLRTCKDGKVHCRRLLFSSGLLVLFRGDIKKDSWRTDLIDAP